MRAGAARSRLAASFRGGGIVAGALVVALIAWWLLQPSREPRLAPLADAVSRAGRAEPDERGTVAASPLPADATLVDPAVPFEGVVAQRSEIERASDDSVDARTLHGFVVDERGVPVEGVAVAWFVDDAELFVMQSELLGRRIEGASTAADGGFELHGVPVGVALHVSATATPERQITVAVAADARSVRIVLPRLGSIAGLIRVGPGVAAEELFLSVTSHDGAPGAAAWGTGGLELATRAQATPDGRFELLHVPVGEWTLHVDHCGLGVSLRVAEVAGVSAVADSAPPDPRLSPLDLTAVLRAVTVEVVAANGAPVSSGWWTLARAADGRPISDRDAMPTDAIAPAPPPMPLCKPFGSGRFTVSVPSGSRHRLHVAAPGHRVAAADLSESQVRVIVGPPVVLRVALDSELRELARLAPANLTLASHDRWSIEEFLGSEARFDADGRAEMPLNFVGWLAPRAFMRSSHEAELSSWVDLEPIEVGETVGNEWIELRRAR